MNLNFFLSFQNGVPISTNEKSAIILFIQKFLGLIIFVNVFFIALINKHSLFFYLGDLAYFYLDFFQHI